MAPASDKVTILFLAANPTDTNPLRLGEELRDIKASLRQATHRDRFDAQNEFAVRLDDLRRAILRYHDVPLILHFAGHGNDSALVFEGNDGKAKPVEPGALGRFIKLFTNIQCVILNACYSEPVAEALAEVVPFVVGMATEVTDVYAITFSIAFYDAIGEGLTYSKAFDVAKSSVDMEGGLEEVEPVFKIGKASTPLLASKGPDTDEQQLTRDERRRDQKRYIADVELDLRRNWVDGIGGLAEIIRSSHAEGWYKDHLQRLEKLQRKYCMPERLDVYLRSVGALFRQHENIGVLHRQIESAVCFGIRYDRTLAPIVIEYNIGEPGLSHLVHLFALWEEFLYDAWDVIAAFAHDTLSRVPYASDMVARELSLDGREWLRMHPLLRGIIRLPALDIYREWPTIGIPDGDGLQQSDKAFLKAYSLSHDPFASIVDTHQPNDTPAHLHWVWTNPDWFARLKDQSSIVVADSFADGIAWVAKLTREPSNFQDLNSNTFVIAGIVDSFRSDCPNAEALLDALCKISASKWLELIAKNPGALLALSSDIIDLLFDLLLWHCVDLGIMLRRLGVSSASPAMKGDERRLKLLLKIYIRQCATQRQRVPDPNMMQYLEWLSIRPPGLDEEPDNTVILALLPVTATDFQMNDVNLVTQWLKEANVYFHLVGERQAIEHFRPFFTEALAWTNTEIRAMIDARIAHANMGNVLQAFAHLTVAIGRGNMSPYDYLWEAARGSLHRALKYCRVAVQIHLESGSLDGITEETLRKALDAVNRDES